MRKIIFSPIWSIIVLGILAWVMYINPPFLESLKLRYFDTLIVNQQAVENNIYTVNIDESSLEENEFLQWMAAGGFSYEFMEAWDTFMKKYGLKILRCQTS